MLNSKICGKYSIRKKLATGDSSEVFLIKSPTGEDLALKCEYHPCRNPQLYYEGRILSILQGGLGMPSLIWSGEENNKFLLILELLGSSLSDLFLLLNNKFCLKTVLMLADQILSRVEFLHQKSYVHRDLNPSNLLIGLNKRSSLLYLIDFGLAKRFRHPKTHEHIQMTQGKKVNGNLGFASINVHNGIEYSRRDDIISVAFILAFFIKGDLPWLNLADPRQGKRSRKERIAGVKEKKISVSVDELLNHHPAEFKHFLNYAVSLKFDEEPDYSYLRRMFKGLYVGSGFEEDFLYDWSLLNGQELKKAKRIEEEAKARKLRQEEKVREKKKKKTCVMF
jgi:casein kinase 1